MSTSRSPASARPVTEPEPKFPAQRQQPPGLESELDPAPRWRAERYKPAGKLEDQVALVTGGDSGIGRAVAYMFAREGADVAITAMSVEESDARETAAAIEETGRRSLILQGDLSTKDFCDEVIQKTLETFGHLEILVHNAAWQNRKPVSELSEDELDMTIKTNVYASLRLVRAAAPHLKPGASIIATGSIVGLEGSPNMSDYGATKGAIHAITRSLAEEFSERRIRVNCVAPGPVWTPLNPADTGLSPEDVATFGQKGKGLKSRPAQPEEIASEADSSYLTGVVIPITGGPA